MAGLTAIGAAGGRRPRVPWLLVPPVLLAHLWLADRWAPEGFGFGDESPRIARINVAFVRTLEPASPPLPPPRRAATVAAAPVPAPAASAAGASDGAATAPLDAAAAAAATALADAGGLSGAIEPAPPARLDPPASAAADAGPSALAASAAAPDTASSPVESVPAAALGPEPAASAPAFEWPPSTRLSYVLTGNYRGPVEGQARVEWVMVGRRYQVHLEVSVGPPFAPLVARRLSSEGEVTPDGLVPRRYEEETRVAFRDPRRLAIIFEPERVLLPGGRTVPRPSGVQDSASQFVQMTWLFITQADLLAPGRSIELPLALPRQVDAWIYDVLGEETLYTPVGQLQAMHVRPRREARPGGDLTAEFWVAPTLQYLPVRIVIRQDAETWVDLLLERLPQQALR